MLVTFVGVCLGLCPTVHSTKQLMCGYLLGSWEVFLASLLGDTSFSVYKWVCHPFT